MREQHLFTKLFESVCEFIQGSSKQRSARRLDLEPLGERIVPTTFWWTSQGDGTSWKDPANWGATMYPGMGGVTTDSAIINDIGGPVPGGTTAPTTGVHVDMPDPVTLRSLTFNANASNADSINFHSNVTLTNGGSFTDANENRDNSRNSAIWFSGDNSVFRIAGGTFTYTAGNFMSQTPTMKNLNVDAGATLRNDGAVNTSQLLLVNLTVSNAGTWELANQSKIAIGSASPSITIQPGGTMSLIAPNDHGIVRQTGTDNYIAIDDQGTVQRGPAAAGCYGIDACIHVSNGGQLSMGTNCTIAFYGKTGDANAGTGNRGGGVFMEGSTSGVTLSPSATLQCDFGYQQNSGTLICLGDVWQPGATVWTIDTAYQGGNVTINGGTVYVGTPFGDYGNLKLHTQNLGSQLFGIFEWDHGTIYIGALDDTQGHQSSVTADFTVKISNPDGKNNPPVMTTRYTGTDPIDVIISRTGTILDVVHPAPANYTGATTAEQAHYTLTHN